jgi:hypothetical protein
MPEDEQERSHMNLRPGRLANVERLEILNELGKLAQERYADIISINHFGYDLDIIKDGLQFKPNVQTFENEYWIDNGSEELNLIAHYFEYGTGIQNTSGPGKAIIPLQKKAMKFFAKRGALIFARRVKGVRPLFMFERTMSEMNNNRSRLMRRFRLELDI